MIPIVKRPYKIEDKNFILNSYIKSNSNNRNLPSWAYKKLHDKVEENLPSTVVVCYKDDEDEIIGYSIGTFLYIKYKFREWKNDIVSLLLETGDE